MKSTVVDESLSTNATRVLLQIETTLLLQEPKKWETHIKFKYKDEKERSISEIDFRNTSDRLKEEYLDRYEGVKSEILSTTRFDENSDLSMT